MRLEVFVQACLHLFMEELVYSKKSHWDAPSLIIQAVFCIKECSVFTHREIVIDQPADVLWKLSKWKRLGASRYCC